MNPLKSSGHLRADAALVLHHILEHGLSSRECLPAMQQGYSEQDKAWLQEMVFGVLRQLPLLQYWLRQLLDKPLKKRAKVIEHLLLLGFYQLAFSRVSQHAAVAETVGATRALKTEPLKGLVNAVLRNFIRQDTQQQRPDDPQILSGLPKWLYKQLAVHYPQQLDSLLPAMQSKAPIWLRVNPRKISTQAFQQALEKENIHTHMPSEQAQGLILQKSTDVTSLPGFDQGWFAVQDGAAQLAAGYLAAKPGERVLDVCAAPGGKTCHILELQSDLASCVALDVDQDRLHRVRENLTRLGHSADLICADGCAPDTWWDGKLFDRILLDAPCSATGVIRRHPDIKWLRKGSDIAALVKLQQQLLHSIWPLLKPGGMLLYATCSILPAENQQQVRAFLQQQTDAKQLPIGSEDTDAQLGRQILPGEGQMDGFYYARLLKSAE